MANSLADDVSYDNMALLEKLHGKSAVAAFYLEALACVPDEALFVIEAMTPGSGCCSVGVVWQLVLSSSNTPMSRGLSMFSVTPGGLIQSVTESPEHPVKMTQSGLVLLGPLMRNLSGPVLPAVNQVNRALQGGLEQLFQPLVPLFSQQNSSGYEASLDVLGLSGLQKVTARLIEGLEIQQTSTKFTVSFLTVVPFFKVTEQVPLDGSSSQQGRRDLRSGRQKATGRLNGGSGVSVVMEWGPPLAGSLTEQYTLLPDGSLKVHAETAVGQKFAAADTVYRRSGVSRDVLLANSRQRHGSVNDVIRQQKEQGLKM
eukprot:gene9316-9482_t